MFTKKILVIPTIREKNIKEFLLQWENKGGWDEIIVIEDNPTKSFELSGKNLFHYSWEDMKPHVGANEIIFSRRDSAIRSFGFYLALKAGAGYIFTLDDDCLPSSSVTENNTFCAQHLFNLNNLPQWSESILGLRTRGIPYRNLGKLENVKINMGLWENVPDYDSIQQLSLPEKYFSPPKENRILPRNQYVPICGMNLAFKRDVVSLSYFPLMGQNSEFNRFDDIWFGIIAKKICDQLNFSISVGNPIINHSRASNPFINLIKEAKGIKYNELFWKEIDNIDISNCKDVPSCVEKIGKELKDNSDDYLKKIGSYILIWNNLCLS